MNPRDLTRTPALRTASGALVAASAVLLWTVVGAFRPVPIQPAAPSANPELEALTRPPIRPPANVQSAVENDLFNPDRSAPDSPYRMPGESAADDKPRVDPPKPLVLGTAVASDGRNFATVQLGSESPRLVRVGDRIGEWIVKSITRGKVVLESAEGSRAELAVPHPGP